MYINIKMAAIEKNVSIQEIANKLGIHRNTLAKKINDGRLYTDELLAIRNNFFPDMSLDILSYIKAV